MNREIEGVDSLVVFCLKIVIFIFFARIKMPSEIITLQLGQCGNQSECSRTNPSHITCTVRWSRLMQFESNLVLWVVTYLQEQRSTWLGRGMLMLDRQHSVDVILIDTNWKRQDDRFVEQERVDGADTGEWEKSSCQVSDRGKVHRIFIVNKCWTAALIKMNC